MKHLGPPLQEKGLELRVEIIDSVPDVESCLPSFKLHGAFQSRGGLEAPHSFTYIRREGPHHTLVICPWSEQLFAPLNMSDSGGLPSTYLDVAEGRLPAGLEPSPLDTFALVKQWMADAELSQPPLVVLPGTGIWREQVETTVNRLAHLGEVAVPPAVPRQRDPEGVEGLRRLAAYLERHYQGMESAVQYLRRLAGVIPWQPRAPDPFHFLAAGPLYRQSHGVIETPVPTPVTAHRLGVSFNRKRRR